MIEASNYPQDIKAVVEDLKASASWHHSIVNNCTRFTAQTTFVQTASGAIAFSARAARIITQGHPDSLIHTGASAVAQAADCYTKITESKQRLLSNARNILIATATNGGSKLIAPHASKFFLNFIAPSLIQQIASNFDSNWSFAVTQVASFYGWLAFMSLISGLQDVYSSSNIASSNALPVHALAANAVEFLATRPQTISELLTNTPTETATAKKTFDALLTQIQDPNCSIFTSHTDILKHLKTLGILTKTLPVKMQTTFENFETAINLALRALKPIFHHQRDQTAQQEPPLLLEDAPVEQQPDASIQQQRPVRLVRSSSSAINYTLSMLFLHANPDLGTLAENAARARGTSLRNGVHKESRYLG